MNDEKYVECKRILQQRNDHAKLSCIAFAFTFCPRNVQNKTVDEILVMDAATLTTDQNSPSVPDEDNGYEQQIQKLLQSAQNTDTVLVVCNRCKSKDIAWMQKQTRSADEAATLFATCKNCGLKWKS